MNKYAQRVNHLKKLQRLQQSRIRMAEASYREAEVECRKVEEALQIRQARIDDMHKQLADLNSFTNENDATEFARYADYADARKKWLEHDLERDEYWLQDDEHELSTAQTKVAETRGLWLRMQSREAGIKTLRKEAQSQNNRLSEAIAELEDAELTTKTSGNRYE